MDATPKRVVKDASMLWYYALCLFRFDAIDSDTTPLFSFSKGGSAV